MINPEPCRGCGRPIIIHPVANLVVRIEPVPLTDAEIVGELLAGHPLWANDSGKVRPARTGERGVAREHRCTVPASAALSRPRSAPNVQPAVVPPKGSPVGRTAPSWADPADVARPAPSQRPSDGRTHPCSTCGAPIALDAPEEAVLIHLGATLVDCFHAGECPRESEGLPDRSA